MAYTATALPSLTSGSTPSAAQGVSTSGAVIVGYSVNSDDNQQACYWDTGGVHALPFLGTAGGTNIANGCSADGSVIVGVSQPLGGALHAVTWTGGPSWVVTDLGTLPGGLGAVANHCSSNGSVIVGSSGNSGGNEQACVWTNGSVAALPFASGYEQNAAGNFCSADGGTIVGFSQNIVGPGTNFTVPVLWNGAPSWLATTLETIAIADLDGNQAYACSSSGAITAGASFDGSDNSFAVYWNPGLNQLPGPLGGAGSVAFGCDGTGSTIAGVDVNGNPTVWIAGVGSNLPLFSGALSVTNVNAVSLDASTIVGYGVDADSNQVAVVWAQPGPPPTPAPTPPVVIPIELCGWRGQCGINWNGLALVGDKFTNVVGLSDFTVFTEYGNQMLMLVTSPPIHEDRKRIFIPRFEIEVEAGLGIPGSPETAPLMRFDYSKDGGVTWVTLQVFRSMGAVGEYIKRLRWINIGQSRAWVFRIQYTDAARPAIIGTYADTFKALG
jgi:probable HAF family extracellular repeat protein